MILVVVPGGGGRGLLFVQCSEIEFVVNGVLESKEYWMFIGKMRIIN
jgi:hypothetical protein